MTENTFPKVCNVVGEMSGRDSINYGNKNIYINCSMTDAKRPQMSIPEKIHFFPPSTPHFHGREENLIALTNFVENSQRFENCYEKMIIISGLGGMGKSEIAKVLAKKLKDRFAYIFWFNAQSRASLDSSFKDLLWRLNVELREEDKTPSKMAFKAYTLLEEHFTKCIFVFDNAELLKSEPNSAFGLEEYLLPNDDFKKPLFIVTTRNNWLSLEHPLKIIRLDELSEEEAKVCFLKYLRIEGLELPLSLSSTIDKLVYIVQGHPLGISIMGMEAARQEDEISFGDVETRITNYLRLLEDQPLEELTGQEKYQRNLQIIFDERMRKLETTETGRDAAEILSILSLFSPDEIYVGLVNGIFSRKIFYPQQDVCQRFLLGDCKLRVLRALKLLQSNSLIRIESVEIYSMGTFDMIRIHRLVQRCAQNCHPKLLQPTPMLQSIGHFFAINENNLDFEGHMSSILKSLHETTFTLENWVVLSLLLDFILMDSNNGKTFEVTRLLRSRKWNAGEKLVVSLIHIFAEPDPKEKSVFREELKELMLGIPEDLIRRGSILELCTQLLYPNIQAFDEQERRTLQSWLKKCYLECPSVNRNFRVLLECVYVNNDPVFDAYDGEFVLKVFSNTSTREREWFWDEMSELKSEIFMGLVPYFFSSSGETNVFVKSLEFSTQGLKIYFLKEWAKYFEQCVSSVIEDEWMREKLLGTEEFARALKDITELGFNEITREFHWITAEGTSHLLLIWLRLFSAHEVTYKKFGEFVDRLLIDLPDSTESRVSRSIYGGNEFIRLSSKLIHLDYCSPVTKSWIQTGSQINHMMKTNLPMLNQELKTIFPQI